MTVAEKNYIIRYRQMGKSCTEIARALGLSANTVKESVENSLIPYFTLSAQGYTA